MRRPNKATLQDPDLGDAFRQGFEEGMVVVTEEWVYTLQLFFEGNLLREVSVTALDEAMTIMQSHLQNGPETRVVVEVRTGATQPPGIAAGDEGGVIEGEIVEEG